MMNKLGFAIELASQGTRNAIECNSDGGQWISKVVDIREYLKLFEGLQGTDNIVTFMSFDQSGCFLTQLRAISGRCGDFLSGWIYIPNTIEATGEEVVNALSFVGNILGKSNLDECKGDIEKFFSKEYLPKEKGCIVSYSPSSGEKFGVRYLNSGKCYYTMKKILDVGRYQTYYSKYKAIFLLDKSGEVNISEGEKSKFDDLTDNEISEMCILVNPSLEKVATLGNGTKIVFGDGKEFNSPVLLKKGDELQLYAKREGFENVPLPIITMKIDRQTLSINPKSVNWQKKITSSMFKIINKNQEEIGGACVYVNGSNTPLTNNGVLKCEKECSNLDVKITAPGYENRNVEVNLLSDQCTIWLSRKEQSDEYEVELFNGGSAKMTLKSKDLLPTDDSPLKGYHCDEKGVLRLSSKFVWKQRILGFLAALGAALLIIVYIAIDAWTDTHHFKLGLPPWEESTQTQTDSCDDTTLVTNNEYAQSQVREEAQVDSASTKAVKYLEDNNLWEKSEMEKYPYLQGLYDDMNNFELDALLDVWANKLSESERFKSICNAAKKIRGNNWKPKQDKHNSTYNKGNDETINITNYINRLEQDQTKTPDGGGASNSGTPGKSKPQTDARKDGAGKSDRDSGKDDFNKGNANI